MDLLNQLKSAKNLSPSERLIADYILSNPVSIITMTAVDLSVITYSSSTTVIRLCKKIGINRFSDFKLKLAYEINTFVEKQFIVEADPLSAQDNIFSIVGKVAKIQTDAINETRVMLDMSSVTRVVDYIIKAEQIDFYGMGLHSLAAQDAAYKFTRIGKRATSIVSLNFQYAQLLVSDNKSVAFLLSGSGENSFMIDAAEKLKKLKVKTIAITGSKDSTLAKLCDEYFIAISRDNFMRLSTITLRASSTYILDVLFCATYVSDYERNVKRFEEYEELAKNLLYPIKK